MMMYSLQRPFFTAFLALAWLSMPAGLAPSSAQDAARISTGQIFSVTTGDWNKDGAQDAVIMIDTGEDFDVLFYLTDEEQRLKLHQHAKALVWGSSTLFGQEPSVSTRENGSLMISSQNSSIGRERWEEHLTVIYRQNQFIVAGYSYSHYDTLDPDANGGCDLNLLTGKGDVNGKEIRFDGKPSPIAAFADQSEALRQLCIKPR